MSKLIRAWLLTLSVAIAMTGVAAAQEGGPPPATAALQKEAMQKVAFLVGEWKGGGWMMMGPGQRQEFTGTEKVESRLDGLVLIIEGTHESSDPARKGAIVHHALATLSWDPRHSTYQFHSHLATGPEGYYSGTVAADGAFMWTLPAGPGGTMRYTIKLDDKGRWSENGERSTDDGKTWQPFFAMTLDRVK